MKVGHTTSGTTIRSAHPLSGQGLTFHLDEEIAILRAELARTSGGRAAKTLVKSGGLRATLVLLRAGIALDPQATAGGATVQVMEGRLRVHVDGQTLTAEPGDLVALSENLREPVRAEQESAFLVTVAWPEGAGAWSQEVSGGHLA